MWFNVIDGSDTSVFSEKIIRTLVSVRVFCLHKYFENLKQMKKRKKLARIKK